MVQTLEVTIFVVFFTLLELIGGKMVIIDMNNSLKVGNNA